MAKRKKKNNVVCINGNYYYRVRIFLYKIKSDNGDKIFQKETKLKLVPTYSTRI